MNKDITLGCMPCTTNSGRMNVIPSPGSIQAQCDQCECNVWLGIKQQEYQKEHPEVTILCLVCVAYMNKAQRDELNVVSLGGESAKVEIDGVEMETSITQEEADKADAWMCSPATTTKHLDRLLVDKCTRCGQDVWYDPEMAVKCNAPKICVPCAVDMGDEDSMPA